MAETQEQSRADRCRHLDALVQKASSSSGAAAFDLYEQVCVAALDVKNENVFKKFYGLLEKQFPKSKRLQILTGLNLEAKQQWDAAKKTYEDMLKEDETNVPAQKRLIAIAVAQGRVREAIDKLNEYLTTYMADFEAWQELMELYLKCNDFENAIVCIEELILANPHNFWFHVKLAEVHYTLGRPENLRLARHHYAHALTLNPDCLRAQYGLLLTSLKTSTSGTASKHTAATVVTCRKDIEKAYAAASPASRAVATAVLATLTGDAK